MTRGLRLPQQGQPHLSFRLIADPHGHTRRPAPLGIIGPGLGQKQAYVHQGVSPLRGVGQEDAELAVAHLPQRPTVLPRYPH